MGLGQIVAQTTKFPAYNIDEEEARTVTRPLARILARNPKLLKTVREVSDPVALVTASFFLIAPRVASHKLYLDHMKQQPRFRVIPGGQETQPQRSLKTENETQTTAGQTQPSEVVEPSPVSGNNPIIDDL